MTVISADVPLAARGGNYERSASNSGGTDFANLLNDIPPVRTPGVTVGDAPVIDVNPPGVRIGDTSGVHVNPPRVTIGNPPIVDPSPPHVIIGDAPVVDVNPPHLTIGEPQVANPLLDLGGDASASGTSAAAVSLSYFQNLVLDTPRILLDGLLA